MYLSIWCMVYTHSTHLIRATIQICSLRNYSQASFKTIISDNRITAICVADHSPPHASSHTLGGLKIEGTCIICWRQSYVFFYELVHKEKTAVSLIFIMVMLWIYDSRLFFLPHHHKTCTVTRSVHKLFWRWLAFVCTSFPYFRLRTPKGIDTRLSP
jgi:hypothetical protein